MRNRFVALLGAEVRIGLAKNALSVVRFGMFAKSSTILLDEEATDDLSAQLLGERCRAALTETSSAGLPLSITLGDELVRLFMVTPPQNAARLQDLSAAANLRFQSLYGEPPRDWHVDADWQTGKPFLACAVPRALVEHCRDLARQMRMPLVALQPQFVAAWNTACRDLVRAKDQTWLGVLHGHNLSLGIVTAKPQRHLSAVRCLTLPAGKADLDWLQDQILRAAMQAGVGAADSILLAGDARNEWTEIQNPRFKVTRVKKAAVPDIQPRRPKSDSPPAAEGTSA